MAVIQEAYVKGVSTRKVDDLVRAMGASGVSKSEVSRLVVELDVDLAAFRERRLDETRYPYLWLDAQYEKVRDGGRIVNAAFLIAIAANERGEREVLGCAVASAESEASWTAFLRSLVARGLGGVRLVTSDAHLGIRAAVASTLDGAAWQRCRVHLLRDILTHVPRHAAAMVAAFVRTIFAQPDEAAARTQLHAVAERLATSFPKAAEVLLAAEDDVLAYLACPREHWTKIWSTNPLERVNRELARRNDVVGIFLRVLLQLDIDRSRSMSHRSEGPRVTRNLSVEPPGSDLVRASPLGSFGRPSDLIAACRLNGRNVRGRPRPELEQEAEDGHHRH